MPIPTKPIRSAILMIAGAALIALSLSTSACLVRAAGYDDGTSFEVGFEPPPLRDEVVVERPSGEHVWIGGHWDWDRSRHDYSWVSGRWERPPHARARWVAPHYEKRGRKSYYVSGHWHG
jgi:WXXGXW repeat (2 copies)